MRPGTRGRERLLAAALASVLAALAPGCGDENAAESGPGSAPAGGARTSLLVEVDRDGPTGRRPPLRLRVSCPGGDPRACQALARVPEQAFAPVAPGTACTELYGGPETAEVSGRLEGRPLRASFSRSDGCQIARWEQAAPLLRLAG